MRVTYRGMTWTVTTEAELLALAHWIGRAA